jgi:hypothetical protein
MSNEPPDDRHEGADLPFGSLAEGPQPPADLEDRTVRALRERGLIAPESAPVRHAAWRYAAAMAAGLLLYGAGYLTGRPPGVPRGAGEEAANYMLLLRESDAMVAATRGAGDALVREYAAWAAAEAGRGRLTGGGKLDEAPRYLRRGDGGEVRPTSHPDPGERHLSGYFLIAATGEDEALAIAAGCPHLGHGGTIELRRIEGGPDPLRPPRP